VKDDLTPVLDRIKKANALIIGTPVYYLAESARTRAFLERLCFPYLKYAKDYRSLFPRRINTALIYTMNAGEELLELTGLNQHFNMMKAILTMNFGACELLCSPRIRFSIATMISSNRKCLTKRPNTNAMRKSFQKTASVPLI